MYLLKWVREKAGWRHDADSDFFATANDMDEARKLAAEAYNTAQIDDGDNVQVFTAEDSGEYYPEPVAEWSISDFQ